MEEYSNNREMMQNALDIIDLIGDEKTLANREEAMAMYHAIYKNAQIIFEDLYEITGEMIQEEKGLPREEGRKSFIYKDL